MKEASVWHPLGSDKRYSQYHSTFATVGLVYNGEL